MGDGGKSEERRAEVALVPHQERGVASEETLVREMLDLERQRIASQDKKTDTARLFIEAQDASDRRQFDFSMDKLNRDDSHRKERHKLLEKVIYVGGAVTILVLFSLLGFMFFGSPFQSGLALGALKTLFVGGAGYGLISGIVSATKKLLYNGG